MNGLREKDVNDGWRHLNCDVEIVVYFLRVLEDKMEGLKEKIEKLSRKKGSVLEVLGVVTAIYDKVTKEEKGEREKYMEALYECSRSQNPTLASHAIDALTRILPPQVLVREIISQLPNTINPGVLARGIGRVLRITEAGNYEDLVTVLKSSPGSWPWILDEMRGASSLEPLKPIFRYVLLDPSHSVHFAELRHLLKDDLLHRWKDFKFITECIPWLIPSKENRQWIMQASEVVLNLVERLPLICSLIVDTLIEGMDPTELINSLKINIDACSSWKVHSLCLILLTDAFDNAFVGHFQILLDVIHQLFRKIRFKPILGYFIGSLLAVTIMPSKLISDECWKLASEFLRIYYEESSMSIDNEIEESFKLDCKWNQRINGATLQLNLLIFFSKSKESSIDWLRDESLSTSDKRRFYLARSLFLDDNNVEIVRQSLQVFKSHVKTTPERSIAVLAVLLHRLSKERNPESIKLILENLSIVAVDKNAIKFILLILDTISNTQRLYPVKLKLMGDLCEVESRTFPYLHKALEEKCNTEEGYVAKAQAINRVCSSNLSHFSTDLLPLIPEILNHRGKDVASVLALKAVKTRCLNFSVDIKTTILALEPKILANGSERSRVEFINIIALIPEFCEQNDWYQPFSDEKLKYLWKSVSPVIENTYLIRKSAIFAISKYGFRNQRFDALPTYISEGCEPIRAGEDDDILFVPGECWTKILVSSNEDLVLYEELFFEFLRQELKSLPPSAYYMPSHKRQSDFQDYSYLNEKSLLRHLVAYIKSKDRCPVILGSCLNILSRDYDKPFPPLDWGFLTQFLKMRFKECFLILVHQLEKSSCAKALIENLISQPLNIEETLLVIECVEEIVKFHPCPALEMFFENISLSLSNARSSCQLILEKFDNKNNSWVEYDLLLDFIKSLKNQAFDEKVTMEIYLRIIKRLPHEYWRELSNPILSQEISERNLCESFEIRGVLSEADSYSLVWFNDCIEVAALKLIGSPKVFSIMLRAFINARTKSNPENNRRWLSDLMGQTLSFLRQQCFNSFYLLFDLFVCALITFSGVLDFVYPKSSICENSDQRLDLLPVSVQFTLDNPHKSWNTFGPQCCEWFMRLLKENKIHGTYKASIRSALSSFKYGKDFAEMSRRLIKCSLNTSQSTIAQM